MTPEEIALANRGGRSFADLCDDVRQAKVKHLRAIRQVEWAEEQLTAAKAARDAAQDAHDNAMDALDNFITRECAITPEGETA